MRFIASRPLTLFLQYFARNRLHPILSTLLLYSSLIQQVSNVIASVPPSYSVFPSPSPPLFVSLQSERWNEPLLGCDPLSRSDGTHSIQHLTLVNRIFHHKYNRNTFLFRGASCTSDEWAQDAPLNRPRRANSSSTVSHFLYQDLLSNMRTLLASNFIHGFPSSDSSVYLIDVNLLRMQRWRDRQRMLAEFQFFASGFEPHELKYLSQLESEHDSRRHHHRYLNHTIKKQMDRLHDLKKQFDAAKQLEGAEERVDIPRHHRPLLHAHDPTMRGEFISWPFYGSDWNVSVISRSSNALNLANDEKLTEKQASAAAHNTDPDWQSQKKSMEGEEKIQHWKDELLSSNHSTLHQLPAPLHSDELPQFVAMLYQLYERKQGALQRRLKRMHQNTRSKHERRRLAALQKNIVVAIIVHCYCGSDRTGEAMAAWDLFYNRQRWTQVQETSRIVAQRPMGCRNYRSAQWFCLWMQGQDRSNDWQCEENAQCTLFDKPAIPPSTRKKSVV